MRVEFPHVHTVSRIASSAQITDCAQPLTPVITPQYGVPGPCSFPFHVCNWVFFAVAPHSFHFITGANVITYSCPTCNGWDKK